MCGSSIAKPVPRGEKHGVPQALVGWWDGTLQVVGWSGVGVLFLEMAVLFLDTTSGWGGVGWWDDQATMGWGVVGQQVARRVQNVDGMRGGKCRLY